MPPAKHPAKSPWSERANRAVYLAERNEGARELLRTYAKVALFQEKVFADLAAWDTPNSGWCVSHYPPLLELMKSLNLPAEEVDDIGKLIQSAWRGDEIEGRKLFLAEALLQPYAEFFRSKAQVPVMSGGSSCPFCSARPIAALLRPEGDGAKRSLVCSRCSLEWNFRRILCPSCGEEDKNKLLTFSSDHLPHVSVESCETCKVYLKAIDLGKDGLAVPFADEIASVALDLWAVEQGFRKLKTNLLGL